VQHDCVRGTFQLLETVTFTEVLDKAWQFQANVLPKRYRKSRPIRYFRKFHFSGCECACESWWFYSSGVYLCVKVLVFVIGHEHGSYL